jgi:MFS family permease
MPVAPRTILLALVGAHLVNDLYTTVLPAFLLAVAEEFDLDYSELGVLSFAFILLTGALQPVLGNKADRSGQRRFMLVFGFAVGAIGFLAMAMAPSFWFIVSAYPDSRGRMLGYHGWGGSTGSFMAPVAVVLMVSAFNWRVAMALIALPLLVSGLALWRNLDESMPAPKATMRSAVSKQPVLVAITFAPSAWLGLFWPPSFWTTQSHNRSAVWSSIGSVDEPCFSSRRFPRAP